jgi:MFS transporter, DHA2 family, multidrug resistance protein
MTVAHDDWKPKYNPWIIALTVTLATFMEVLDTSIANVALPHIAGNLSTGVDESTWVLSSYMVANAVVLPVGAWLATWFGRKRFYMACVVMFGISSLLCGMAPSLGWLVFFRVLQGLGGGGLAPTEQAILADTFPPAKRGMAFAVYAMAVVMAPAVGPTLGGWVTDHYNWRWIFFINIPVVIVSLFLTSRLVEDPPYLKTQKRDAKIDWVGLFLLATGIGAAQVVFDKGERENWFQSNFIVIFAGVAAVCIAISLVWEWYHENPVIDIHLFRNRNFSVSCIMMFMLGAALFGATVLLPQMLQTLMGYSAQDAGMVLSPGAFVIILMLPLIGKLVGKVDSRYLISIGFAGASLALFYMSSTMSTDMDFSTAVKLRIYQMVFVAFLFVPIQTISYQGVPREKNNNVSGMTNLARNLGGSIGISAVGFILSRRGQFHQDRMSAHTGALDPEFQSRVTALAKTFQGGGMDGGMALQAAYGKIYGAMRAQSEMLGYLDALRVFAILCALMVPLAFLMKKAKPSGEAPPAH